MAMVRCVDSDDGGDVDNDDDSDDDGDGDGDDEGDCEGMMSIVTPIPAGGPKKRDVSNKGAGPPVCLPRC